MLLEERERYPVERGAEDFVRLRGDQRCLNGSNFYTPESRFRTNPTQFGTNGPDVLAPSHVSVPNTPYLRFGMTGSQGYN